MEKSLPAIPAKRYFTIGEVSELCGVKPYVLRYWEQEFTQLKPMKRRGNRRYYQHHEVLLIRRIRELLYDQGFTISGARNRLADAALAARGTAASADGEDTGPDELDAVQAEDEAGSIIETAAAHLKLQPRAAASVELPRSASSGTLHLSGDQLRDELLSIRELLSA
jgi:DNA-binding transcriptional MerR regulator